MKLLLKEDVDGLGFCGDEVEVKDGYGRNFLIPKGKALLATPNNLKAFNHQKLVVQSKVKKVIATVQTIADEIAKVTCTVKKKVGDTGKMFGSVTAQEIADLLKGQGVDIDRRKIQIAEPIKKAGEYKIPVKLHSEVTAQIKLVVEAEQVVAEPAESAEPAEPAESAEPAAQEVEQEGEAEV
ncbi:MAG: 50S ribosomal protein L9 [Nitrospina sp.]|jgi:large subunit ribosomal protein L9|nr:50S ribosomal protein L9 [Nitrospina sp.]MBT3510603.1 50S ribosomal protein L9 [Nitrospina sp.]MBT3875183.1 50S ribosomal protein L9 [Nitrospina sp.]MBT4049840.1 50S ribosomal protein L9 [Nitrospina sp.]MBT4556756.1 50S ribosomal protein L9 [Nitrospina sp.]